MPYEPDCHFFIECNNETAYLKTCPVALDWDPLREMCNWPSEAACRPEFQKDKEEELK